MTTDLHARLVDAAVASVRSGTPLADVVGEVVGLASAEMPSHVWDDILAVDVAADLAKATPWLARQPEERPLPADTSGFLFGLYVVRGAVPGFFEATVAWSAGPGYPDPNWMAEQNWDAAGYIPASGLRSLMPLVAEESLELRALVAGPVVFAYALGLVAAGLDGVDPGPILGTRPSLGVVVGIPKGETVILGALTPGGLDRSNASRADPAPFEAEAPPTP